MYRIFKILMGFGLPTEEAAVEEHFIRISVPTSEKELVQTSKMLESIVFGFLYMGLRKENLETRAELDCHIHISVEFGEAHKRITDRDYSIAASVDEFYERMIKHFGNSVEMTIRDCLVAGVLAMIRE